MNGPLSQRCYNKIVNKKINKPFKILLLFFLFLLSIKIFFKFIYFPTHPSIFSKYQQRSDYDSNLDNGKIELLELPLEGCFNICWGKEKLINCKDYSRKYDNCNYNCYGYVYNNCSSSKLGIIFGLLLK